MPRLLNDDALGLTAVVSSFGAESAVLLHYVTNVLPNIAVLFLDTGKHFSETIAYRDVLVEKLGLNLQIVVPEDRMLASEDPSGRLHEMDPNACCTIRKTFPLQDAITPFNSWISGRNRYQGGSRVVVPVIERDGEKLKLNPLAVWSKDDVDAYFESQNLLRHPLESKGFPSIGCLPCTRPVAHGEDPRAGRWAHAPEKTECGIHLGPDGRFSRSSTNN